MEETPNELKNNDISLIEEQQTKKLNKKNKASKVLFIFGTILLFLAIIFVCIYGKSVYNHYTTDAGNQGGTALGMVLTFIYFGFIGIIISAIASVLNIVSFSISKNNKLTKLVFMIISILVTILYIIFIILMSIN